MSACFQSVQQQYRPGVRLQQALVVFSLRLHLIHHLKNLWFLSANCSVQTPSGVTIHTPLHLHFSLCFSTSSLLSPSPVSVVCVSVCVCVCVCDHLTPCQQGSSFLPVCLLPLSSFTSWLDHQPCKEDLWPWSTQNGICWALGTRWGARWICSQQVSHTKFKPFVLVLTTGRSYATVMRSASQISLAAALCSVSSNNNTTK